MQIFNNKDNLIQFIANYLIIEYIINIMAYSILFIHFVFYEYNTYLML